MDRNAAVKWGIGAFLVLGAVGGAFVGGLRVGSAIPGRMSETLLVGSIGANANQRLGYLVLLDRGESMALRERLGDDQDSDLLALCGMLRAPTAGASDASWRVIARVARYRADHPGPSGASLPGAEPARVEAKRRVDACLKAALEKGQEG